MTEEEQQMINFYKEYSPDAYDTYKFLLENRSKEQLAVMIVQLADEINLFKNVIRKALGKETY